MSLTRDGLVGAIRGAMAGYRSAKPWGESEFQEVLASALGCSREVAGRFNDPTHHPKEIPERDLRALGEIWHEPHPPDPCVKTPSIDLVTSDGVPIEVKFRAKHNSDVYGYQFLRDIYRLERIESVGDMRVSVATPRLAVFVTDQDRHYDPAKKGDAEGTRISHGLSRPAKSWVQYRQPSVRTRWFDYPPFWLANPYRFDWEKVGIRFRVLIVDVQCQSSTK